MRRTREGDSAEGPSPRRDLAWRGGPSLALVGHQAEADEDPESFLFEGERRERSALWFGCEHLSHPCWRSPQSNWVRRTVPITCSLAVCPRGGPTVPCVGARAGPSTACRVPLPSAKRNPSQGARERRRAGLTGRRLQVAPTTLPPAWPSDADPQRAPGDARPRRGENGQGEERGASTWACPVPVPPWNPLARGGSGSRAPAPTSARRTAGPSAGLWASSGRFTFRVGLLGRGWERSDTRGRAGRRLGWCGAAESWHPASVTSVVSRCP